MNSFITSGPGYVVVVSVPWMRANFDYIILYSFYYLHSGYIIFVLFSSFMNLKCMFYDVLDSTYACSYGRFCVNLSSIKQSQQVNASDVFLYRMISARSFLYCFST